MVRPATEGVATAPPVTGEVKTPWAELLSTEPPTVALATWPLFSALTVPSEPDAAVVPLAFRPTSGVPDDGEPTVTPVELTPAMGVEPAATVTDWAPPFRAPTVATDPLGVVGDKADS